MSGVAGMGSTKADGPLKLAVPRGALFGETLDVLDGAGIDTSEVRGDSRSLIFETEGMTLVTMRPSDVPTYVEAGAADVGITGKDVLLEQADRVQIDLGLLRDLGYYSGAILEVYDPALGHVLGGGGRYDGLLKRFGVDLPAAGFALYLERVHVAQMEESRRGREAR
jgi:hypothetical protein